MASEQQERNEQRTNSLGEIGFCAVLLGVFFHTAALIGVGVSLVALIRKPRGYAAAGILIGTSMIGVDLAGDAFREMGRSAASKQTAEILKPMRVYGVLYEAVEIVERRDGQFPAREPGQALISLLRDPYGNELRYETDGRRFSVRCAGRDGEFDTPDDRSREGPRWRPGGRSNS